MSSWKYWIDGTAYEWEPGTALPADVDLDKVEFNNQFVDQINYRIALFGSGASVTLDTYPHPADVDGNGNQFPGSFVFRGGVPPKLSRVTAEDDAHKAGRYFTWFWTIAYLLQAVDAGLYWVKSDEFPQADGLAELPYWTLEELCSHVGLSSGAPAVRSPFGFSFGAWPQGPEFHNPLDIPTVLHRNTNLHPSEAGFTGFDLQSIDDEEVYGPWLFEDLQKLLHQMRFIAFGINTTRAHELLGIPRVKIKALSLKPFFSYAHFASIWSQVFPVESSSGQIYFRATVERTSDRYEVSEVHPRQAWMWHEVSAGLAYKWSVFVWIGQAYPDGATFQDIEGLNFRRDHFTLVRSGTSENSSAVDLGYYGNPAFPVPPEIPAPTGRSTTFRGAATQTIAYAAPGFVRHGLGGLVVATLPAVEES